MDNVDEKINSGVNEIKNIKMTSNEKDHIFQNILNGAKPTPRPVRSPFFLFSPNYSPYLGFAVLLIIILAGGGMVVSKNSNKNFAVSPRPNYYQEMNLTGNNSFGIQNNNVGTTQNDKVAIVVNDRQIQKENENISINQPAVTTPSVGMLAALSPNVIYKTRKDYSNNISVCYKNGEITCYPGPTNAMNQRPIKLANGYLLKEMPGDVFLNTTIDEFINYEGDWLNFIKVENIIDYNPFTEIYSCPSGISEEEINNIILSNKVQTDCENILNNN